MGACARGWMDAWWHQEGKAVGVDWMEWSRVDEQDISMSSSSWCLLTQAKRRRGDGSNGTRVYMQLPSKMWESETSRG